MALVILRKVGRNFGSELEIRFFKHSVSFYALYCVSDAVLLPMKSGLVPPHALLYSVLVSLSMSFMSLTALFWFCYAQARLRTCDIENHTVLVVCQLPMALLILLYVTNPLTNWMYTLSASGEFIRGPLYLLAALLTGGYILCVAGQAVMRMHMATTKAQRKEFSLYVWFAVIPVISSVVNPLVPNTPIMALCLLAALLLVFSNLQDAHIFNDALTGLNNRRRADQYLSAKIATASSEHAVYVYVLDVNLFKRINDVRGHIEGDHALQVVAEGLRHAAGVSHGFAARWGGDEFVLVVDEEKAESPDAVVATIDECLAKACEEAHLPYDLTVTTGYAVCMSSDQNPDEILSRADNMLYERKQSVHQRVA